MDSVLAVLHIAGVTLAVGISYYSVVLFRTMRGGRLERDCKLLAVGSTTIGVGLAFFTTAELVAQELVLLSGIISLVGVGLVLVGLRGVSLFWTGRRPSD